MKIKTKIYSIDFKQAFEKCREKLNTTFELVEVVSDVDKRYYHLLCTRDGRPYDECSEQDKNTYTVFKTNYIKWCVDRAMVIYNRRPTKLKKFDVDSDKPFPIVRCYE